MISSDYLKMATFEEKKSGGLVGPNDPSLLEQASLRTSKYESDDDILGHQDVDRALNMKMHLVNNVRTCHSLLNS